MTTPIDTMSILASAEMAVRSLESEHALRVACRRELEPCDGRFIPPDGLALHPELAGYLAQRFPSGLFAHQHEAIETLLAGRHTIVSTPTSSGKTLIFSVPVFDRLLRDPNATAILLYPQKALANDQLGTLRAMWTELCGSSEDAERTIVRYDGSTATEDREPYRRNARLFLMNPDMLHHSPLRHLPKWERVIRNLSFVVVDEAHDYRGIFGSSVAYILRRLLAAASRFGAAPTLAAASATIRDPTSHMSALTGVEFTEINADRDGSIQGHRRLWLLGSDEHCWQTGRRLTQELVDRGLSCLTFCGSRRAAEHLFDDMPESLKRDRRVRVYRAGLSAAEREEVERQLRAGTVRAVFATSALELGIDIGQLDAVVCVGLPPTLMSLWQRAGRVGRSGREGAIFMIGADTPLDTWHLEHPADLFDQDHEPLAVNLRNRRLVAHHLACAIQEAGDPDQLNFDILGAHCRQADVLRRTNRYNFDVFYSDDPHGSTPIRNADLRRYELICDERRIGEIDHWHMMREAHPKAVYMHGGRRYRVLGPPRRNGTIPLREERSRRRTHPFIRSSIGIKRVRRILDYGDVRIKEVDLEVADRLVQIQETDPSGEIVGTYSGPQGLKAALLATEGLAIEVDLTTADPLVPAEAEAVFAAIARLAGSLLPVVIGPCDRQDYSTSCDAADGSVTIYLYDNVHDGIDLTVQAYEHVVELLVAARDRIVNCNCHEDHGCFRCVRSPDEDRNVSKRTCIDAIEATLAAMNRELPRRTDFDVDLLEECSAPTRQCPNAECSAVCQADARFCQNCGEKL